MARFFFNRRNVDPSQRDASRRIGDWVRARLALTDDDGVTVSEIACAHPECGEAETVILVMRAGRRTEAAKVLKPMAEVSEDEVADALAALV